jgi:hypothetical protein
MRDWACPTVCLDALEKKDVSYSCQEFTDSVVGQPIAEALYSIDYLGATH